MANLLPTVFTGGNKLAQLFKTLGPTALGATQIFTPMLKNAPWELGKGVDPYGSWLRDDFYTRQNGMMSQEYPTFLDSNTLPYNNLRQFSSNPSESDWWGENIGYDPSVYEDYMSWFEDGAKDSRSRSFPKRRY